MTQAERLRELIQTKDLVVAPGAYDAITAKLIEKAGFDAVYITGSGISLTLLGQPDLNTVSYMELRERINSLLTAIDIPMIVDIDTGFGGPLSLIRLVQDFERMGVAAVQIEDQRAPKRCGHELNRKVVSAPLLIPARARMVWLLLRELMQEPPWALTSASEEQMHIFPVVLMLFSWKAPRARKRLSKSDAK